MGLDVEVTDEELQEIKSAYYQEIAQMPPREIAKLICYAPSHQSQFLVLSALPHLPEDTQREVQRYVQDSTLIDIEEIQEGIFDNSYT